MTAGTVEYYECILKNLAVKIVKDCANKCDTDQEIYTLFRDLEGLLMSLYYYDSDKSECLYLEEEIAVIKDGIDRLIRNYVQAGNCKNCECG